MLTEELPELLTVAETADLLRIDTDTAYAAISRGELPSIRIGRNIRVPRHRLLALLDGEAEAGDDDV